MSPSAQLQQAVDAAALAAGQDLPDSSGGARARQWPTAGPGRTGIPNMRASAAVVSFKCSQTLAAEGVACQSDSANGTTAYCTLSSGCNVGAGHGAGVGRDDAARNVPAALHDRVGHVDGVGARRQRAPARRDGRARHDRVDAKRRPVRRLSRRCTTRASSTARKPGVSTLLDESAAVFRRRVELQLGAGARPGRPDGVPAAHQFEPANERDGWPGHAQPRLVHAELERGPVRRHGHDDLDEHGDAQPAQLPTARRRSAR